ncbi:restriction endonuclease [Deinococcus sp. VB142]|uniref:Restriction endonuclease n=1 Tax=Deinococcus sp. VB142 TaxID=3112952 RepID=A0AAU6Q4Y8_9DEIO
MTVPKFDQMFNAVLDSLKKLGGSASIEELEELVARNLNLNDRDLAEIHKGNTTKFSYNLAWTRTYLKKAGLLDNSERGVWALTNEGQQRSRVDGSEIKRIAHAQDKRNSVNRDEDEPEVARLNWEDELLEKVKNLSPKAFEHLAQRILRESGFVQVEVTGKGGDGGIDGKGVVRLNLLSFHVHFQCKRYKEVVTPDKIRDFRGAMVGRSDKGLLITTGRFTPEARKEANRDGAPPLELIDGQELVTMLKNLRLGVKVRMVESVEVDGRWFDDFNKANS